MKLALKHYIKKRKYLNVLLYMYHSTRVRSRNLLGILVHDSGQRHAKLHIDESIQYIENVFADYQRIANITQFSGRIAELGPGDSAGIGLMFLTHGAEHVDLADRFYAKRCRQSHREIYSKLALKYPALRKIIADIDIDKLSCLKQHHGPHASGEVFFDSNKDFNTIVSKDVLEHVNQPALILQKMYAALVPGGHLINKVDLKDHGIFTPYQHSVKFLEIPNWLYKLMTYGTGYPNRVLFHEYKTTLLQLNPQCKFYITGLHGVNDDLSFRYLFADIPKNLVSLAINFIKIHRNKFAHKLSKVPAEDLIVSSFFFVCKKQSQ